MLPRVTGLSQLDPSGVWVVYESMVPAARTGIPGYTNGFSLTVALDSVQVAHGFHWNGGAWTAEVIMLRLAWVAAALALVWCCSLFFDRFDPAISRTERSTKPEQLLSCARILLRAAGALFIPSLALVLGVWSGTNRFFEGLYIALWYIGHLTGSAGSTSPAVPMVRRHS